MNRKEFIAYCWEFYGPRGIYGEFFGHTLNLGELEEAVDKRMESDSYEEDSVDREAVRDLMMETRKKFIAERKKAGR